MPNQWKFVAALFVGLSTSVPVSEAASALLDEQTLNQVPASIMKHWNMPHALARVHGMHVEVWFELDRAGNILGKPEVRVWGGTATQKQELATSTERAVLESAPFDMLPPDKYESWRTITAKFVTSAEVTDP